MTIEGVLRGLEMRGYHVRILAPITDDDTSVFLDIYLIRAQIGLDMKPERGEFHMTRVIWLKELPSLRDVAVRGFFDCLLAPFGHGHWHVRHQCGPTMAGYPLLYTNWRGILYRGKPTRMTTELMESLSSPQSFYYQPKEFHEFRSVSAGPDSEPLTRCPRCHGAITKETIEGYDDEKVERDPIQTKGSDDR